MSPKDRGEPFGRFLWLSDYDARRWAVETKPDDNPAAVRTRILANAMDKEQTISVLGSLARAKIHWTTGVAETEPQTNERLAQ